MWPAEAHGTRHEIAHLTLPAPSTQPWAGKEVRVHGTFHVGETRAEGHLLDVYQMRVEHLHVVR